MVLRIVTFNVNGLRSIKEYYASTQKLSFDQFLDTFGADIICFQETKVNKAEMLDHDLAFPKTYKAYFAFPKRPRKIGYSGVVTYVKQSTKYPVLTHADSLFNGTESLEQYYGSEWLETLDSEARVMMTDHGSFILFNVYFPNDGGPERADFRERFYSAASIRFNELVQAGRTVIIACDLNSTYLMTDHCDYARSYMALQAENPDRPLLTEIESFVKGELHKWSDYGEGPLLMENLRTATELFSQQSRENPELVESFFLSKSSRLWTFYQFKLKTSPWIDCFRLLHPDDTNKYTCWNTLMAARGANYGTRIDYIIAVGKDISHTPTKFVLASDLMADVMGSDHCPVWTDFEFPEPPKDGVVMAKRISSSCPLSKQHRLDAFFKPRPKESKPDMIESPRPTTLEEPAPKKIKSVSDSRLPFSKPKPLDPPPLCPKHKEPGRQFTVNKAGPNKGRKFYVCSRPVGHPTDPEARCDFFQWQS